MAERANGILLDTSVVIAHLRGSVDLQTLASPDEPLFLPLVALGELYRGVLKSARPESNRGDLADRCVCLGTEKIQELAETVLVEAEACGNDAFTTVNSEPHHH